MAYFNGTTESASGIQSPIEKFLEYIKWEFSCWNKDVNLNEVHPMNNFVVLDIGYTVKGKLWSDLEQKNTHSIFSNEIKHFWQKLYVTEMNFLSKEKEVIAEWTWEQIKESIPSYAKINLWVIVLDLNDMWVKEFFLYGKNSFNVSKFLKDNATPWDILSIETKVMYTNGSKDKAWNEIMVTEDFVNWLKWIEASKYKNRYVLEIKNSGTKFEDTVLLTELSNQLDEYFKKKNEQYSKWEVEEVKKENKLYQPTTEQLNNETTVEDAQEIFDIEPEVKVDRNWPTLRGWVEIPF